METNLCHTIVVLSHCYMSYVTARPHYSEDAGCMVSESHYIETVDYSNVVDACLEDMPEGKYL